MVMMVIMREDITSKEESAHAPQHDKKRSALWVIISVLLIAVAIVWFTMHILENYAVEIEFDRQILEAFSDVSEGNGVVEAAIYEGHGLHTIVLLNSSGSPHPWTNKIPMEWRPVNVTDVELVVFVGDEKETVETCYYDGPSIKRYQWGLNVELLEAKTGEIVAGTTLYGYTRECWEIELYKTTEIRGAHVEFEKLKQWLETYINADAWMPTNIHEVIVDYPLEVIPLWHSESEELIDFTLWPTSKKNYDYWCGNKPWLWGESKEFAINGTAIELSQPQLMFNFYVFDIVNFDLWVTGKSYDAYYEIQKETSVSFSFSITSEDEVPDSFYFVIEEYSEGVTPEVHVNAMISWIEKNPNYDNTDYLSSNHLSADPSEKARDFMLEVKATETENRKFNFYILGSSNYDRWFNEEEYTAYYEAKDVSMINFSRSLTVDEATSSLDFVVENPNLNVDVIVNISAAINWVEYVDDRPK